MKRLLALITTLILLSLTVETATAQATDDDGFDVPLTVRDVRALYLHPGDSPQLLPFQVNAQGRGDVFQIISTAAGVKFSLILPGGNEVDASTAASADITFAGVQTNQVGQYFTSPLLPGGTQTWVRLPPSAAAGTYQVKVDMTEAADEAVILVSYLPLSAIRAGVTTSASSYRAGETVVLSALLFEGSTPLTGAVVKATFANTEHPELPEEEITLQDSGDFDHAPGDGIYTGTYVPGNEGKYTVGIRAEGTSAAGESFSRVAATDFVVSPPAARFVSFADAGVDSDGNGTLDKVVVTSDVTVQTAGQYQFGITLVASGGGKVNASVLADLEEGAQQLSVSFTAQQLLALGADGPYEMRDAILTYQVGDEKLAADSRKSAGSTGPYSLSSFESPLKFTGQYAVLPFDTNDNGKFDLLEVRVRVHVPTFGIYQWGAELRDKSGVVIDSAQSAGTLDSGESWIILRFDGRAIGRQAADGPYVVGSASLFGAGQTVRVKNLFETDAYTVSQFDGEGFTRKHQVSAVDTNGNGKFDLLRFQTEVYVREAGSYEWSAVLNNFSTPITTARGAANLSAGTHQLTFDFDGGEINTRHADGPYVISPIVLTYKGANSGDTSTSCPDQIETEDYTADQFEEAPPVLSVSASPARAIGGDGDTFVEPGESAAISFRITALPTGGPARNVSATLTTSTPGVTITAGHSQFADMGQGESALNITPFEFRLGSSAPHNLDIEFTLTVSHTGGLTSAHTFTVRAGDVRRIAFISYRENDDGLFLVNEGVGNDPYLLALHAESFAWSPDGRRIAFSAPVEGHSEIFVVDYDGGNLRRLTTSYETTHPEGWVVMTESYDPTWSPDGQKITFARYEGGYRRIYVMNADGSGQTPLTSNSSDFSPTWSPNGTSILFYRKTDTFNEGLGKFNQDIYTVRADGSSQLRLTNNMVNSSPAWSPDGTKIAFVSLGPYDWGLERNTQELYVAQADGSNPFKITDRGLVDDFDWSPNGTRLTYTDKGDVYVVNTNATGLSNLTDGGPFSWGCASPAWSPGGAKLSFVCFNGSNRDVYSLNSDGSNPVLVTAGPADDYQPAWQPDTPPPPTDLSITNVASANPAELERVFAYNISVTNAGPSAATGVVVTDVLPAGVTFFSATATQGSCAVASGTMTCQLGSLAAGGSAGVALQVKPRQTGALSNTASIAAATADPNVSNNSATAQTNVIKSADLKVTNTDSADPVFVGDQMTYTMLVNNFGPVNGATSVVLTDTLPASMTFVSATTTQGSLVTPSIGSTGVVTANLGSLAVNAQATVTVTVKATQAGTVTSTASVSADETDPSTANNTSTQSTLVKAAGVASLQKVLLAKQVLTGGCESTTGQVYLTSPAPTGGVSVMLSSNISGVTVPAYVDIPAGATVSPTFAVTTNLVTTKQVGLVTATSGPNSVSRGITINVGSGTCP